MKSMLASMTIRYRSAALALVLVAFWLALPGTTSLLAADLIRSAKSGAWSAPATWEGGKVPAAGARVQIQEGHTVTYDLKSDAVIRSIHVAGILAFARDRDTQLQVG